MKILLLGNGGREHAMAWKIAKSSKVDQLFIAPGNAGTAKLGRNVDIPITDFEGIAALAINEEIDMLVVGPEVPLVEGITDYFAHHDLLKDIAVIGPSKSAARLEGSKDFAKDFMTRHHIPTAAYATFDRKHYTEACQFLDSLSAPYVLKADGLAAGKGVLILPTLEEAKSELKNMFDGAFGHAANKVVIEEFLSGIECSVFAITDGKHYQLLPTAKDYKRIGEGDTGLNTGGMGSVSPVAFADKKWMKKVEEEIVRPTIEGLQKDGITYKGFIFFGLINCDGQPKVIEYNCRMGDPETETVMLRLQSDIVELFEGVANETLDQCKVVEDPRAAVCIMTVSGGYPGKYKKDIPITLKVSPEDTKVFHAGTRLHNGRLLTNGGRVIAVSAYGADIPSALLKAMKAAEGIQFEGVYYRHDIGKDLI